MCCCDLLQLLPSEALLYFIQNQKAFIFFYLTNRRYRILSHYKAVITKAFTKTLTGL